MSLTWSLNTLLGDGVAGATSLLSGNVGQFVIFAIAVTVIGFLIGAIFYFISLARNRG